MAGVRVSVSVRVRVRVRVRDRVRIRVSARVRVRIRGFRDLFSALITLEKDRGSMFVGTSLLLPFPRRNSRDAGR